MIIITYLLSLLTQRVVLSLNTLDTNILCVYTVKAITNYTPISKYCFKFFSKKSLTCLYKNYKRTGFFKLFLFCVFFCWSIICDIFPHLHLSTYLIFHTPDLFRLYTNTLNYSDILFNFILHTLLFFYNTL